jgi:hypothetical protein
MLASPKLYLGIYFQIYEREREREKERRREGDELRVRERMAEK